MNDEENALETIRHLQNCEESKVKETLQKMGKEILKKYRLYINDDENDYLIPLCIEAYCYIKDKFEDEYCDAFRRKNARTDKKLCGQYTGEEKHWGNPFKNMHFAYLPRKKDSEWWKRCRVDFVPEHDDSFALSYLLKLCIHCKNGEKPELLIQSEIAKLLANEKSIELMPKESNNEPTIIPSLRVGIQGDRYRLSFLIKGVFNETDYNKIRDTRNHNISEDDIKKIVEDLK